MIYPKNQQNLARYLAEPEKIVSQWILSNKTREAKRQVSIETYTFPSQIWPKTDLSETKQRLWQHRLVLYRPDVISANQALLYVNGGTRNQQPQQENPPPQVLDFARLAASTNSLIIDLQDVLNQYLSFED